MKGTWYPYHLFLLLLLGSVAMLSLARINKHNFYHHYFKTIAEVEVRNSQAWMEVQVLDDFRFIPLRKVVPQSFSLWALIRPRAEFFSWVLAPSHRPLRVDLPAYASRACLGIRLIRAP